MPTVRHVDYLGAWLSVLKADNRAIFQAASLASKAAAFIRGFSTELKTGHTSNGDASTTQDLTPTELSDGAGV